MKKHSKIFIVIAICLFSVLTFSACNLQGKSAYDIAVENGYSGTVTEWLESFKGADGKDGKDGVDGIDGIDGKDAEPVLSLYQEAQLNGFEGSFEEFVLQYIKGDKGDTGDKGEKGDTGEKGEKGEDGKDAEPVLSLYQEAVQNGFEGSFDDFLLQLKGDKGDKGETGTQATQYATNKAIRSVVGIYANFNVTSSYIANNTATSAGSGVIYKLDKSTGDATIITNYHVVYYANSTNENKISNDIKVFIYGSENNNNAIQATYIGGSMRYDIAVLKVTGSELLKNSIAVQADLAEEYYVGDTAIAIGNPKAEGISVTSGIVSVDSENITMTASDNVSQVTYRVLRTDCAINEGNSGGGLFNANGELIGIVNAKTTSTNIDNMGYAIPTVIARNVADNILRNYVNTPVKVKKQTFGITLSVKDSIAEYNTEKQKVEIKQTIEISEVDDDSIAKQAGVQVGDILVSYTYKGETKQITRLFNLVDASLTVEENTYITLNVLRNNVEVSINILANSLTEVE